MPDSVIITGSVAAAPADASDGAFPSGTTAIPFSQNAGGSAGKPAAVDTGPQKRNVSSPGAFASLSGVGAADTVTRADTLYLRTGVLMQVRLTMSDGSNPDVVSVLHVRGLCVLEFDAARWLSKVEVQGTGVVEWFASGQQ